MVVLYAVQECPQKNQRLFSISLLLLLLL